MLNLFKTNRSHSRTAAQHLGIEQMEGRRLMAADLAMGAIDSVESADAIVASEQATVDGITLDFLAPVEVDFKSDSTADRDDLSDYVKSMLDEAFREMQERDEEFWATVEKNLKDPDGDGVDDNHGIQRSSSEDLRDRLEEVLRLMQEREEEFWATVEDNIHDPDGDGIDDNHGLQRSSTSSEDLRGHLEEILRHMQEREEEMWATIEKNIHDPDGDGIDDNHGFHRG